jgi:hypothetical protein
MNNSYYDYEEEREVGSNERHYGSGEQNISSVLNIIPRTDAAICTAVVIARCNGRWWY